MGRKKSEKTLAPAPRPSVIGSSRPTETPPATRASPLVSHPIQLLFVLK